MEWSESEPGEIIAQVLDARLVTNRRMRIRRARTGIGRIFAALAVNVIELFGLSVVGLEVIVCNRPRG